MTIQFKEPPPDRRTGNTHDETQAIADALKANPGKWALIVESGWPATGTNIRSGRFSAWQPKGAFEATTRSVGDGSKKVDIYARYVGESA